MSLNVYKYLNLLFRLIPALKMYFISNFTMFPPAENAPDPSPMPAPTELGY
jgi:hypothetical protein